MIVLRCQYCGNEDLCKGIYEHTYRCTICQRDLQLYETDTRYEDPTVKYADFSKELIESEKVS